MANDISNIKDVGSLIAKMSAGMLADKVQFVKSIDKEPAESFEGVNGFRGGETININKPARFAPTSTADISSDIQDVVEERVPLAVDQRAIQAVNLTSAEIQNELSLKQWGKRILAPAISGLAQDIESNCLLIAKNAIYNSVGTAGSTVFNTTTSLAARTKLMKNLAPQDDNLCMLLDSTAMASAVDARKGLFQHSSEIGKQYKMGYMGMADGFTYLENNLLPVHTLGNDVVFEVRTTVSAEGQATLVVEGLTTTTGTVKKGTTFTIDTVFDVHPITKDTLTTLKQFVVTADAEADGSGYATLSISPAMYTTGGRQNISAFPADGDAITPVGAASTSYVQNLAYHKDAFRFVSVPLMMPNDAHLAGQETVDGITVRVWQASNILTDKMILRLDVLYGLAAVRPEWACKITS